MRLIFAAVLLSIAIASCSQVTAPQETPVPRAITPISYIETELESEKFDALSGTIHDAANATMKAVSASFDASMAYYLAAINRARMWTNSEATDAQKREIDNVVSGLKRICDSMPPGGQDSIAAFSMTVAQTKDSAIRLYSELLKKHMTSLSKNSNFNNMYLLFLKCELEKTNLHFEKVKRLAYDYLQIWSVTLIGHSSLVNSMDNLLSQAAESLASNTWHVQSTSILVALDNAYAKSDEMRTRWAMSEMQHKVALACMKFGAMRQELLITEIRRTEALACCPSQAA